MQQTKAVGQRQRIEPAIAVGLPTHVDPNQSQACYQRGKEGAEGIFVGDDGLTPERGAQAQGEAAC